MDISVLYIIPNDRIIETVQRVMQRCDVNYPVYYGTMSGALEIAKRMIAQGSRVIVSTGLTALYLRKHLSVPVLELLFTNTEFARAIQEGLAFSDKILIVASTYVNYFGYLEKMVVFDLSSRFKSKSTLFLLVVFCSITGILY